MGSDSGDWDELPVREVIITHEYRIATQKVTLEEYQRFDPTHTVSSASGSVTGVSWNDAVAYCTWLSSKDGNHYRLPTEAEWERACTLNGGGPGDNTNSALNLAPNIVFKTTTFEGIVYSKLFDAGEYVFGGNDRARTGSAGTFIPIVVSEDPGCEWKIAVPAYGPQRVHTNLQVGAKPYLDREYLVTEMDKSLEGARLVQTCVTEEYSNEDRFLSIQATKPFRLYFVFNKTTNALPSWLGGFDAHGVEAANLPLLSKPTPGKLGLIGMCDDVAEWCHDWYGEYPAFAERDPVGPASGVARVVRGNKIDANTRFMLPHTRGYYYQRQSNRAGMPPSFGADKGPAELGRHDIGFRIVQATMPDSIPVASCTPFVNRGIKQLTHGAALSFGPPENKPYFRKRYLLPSPPETITAFNAQSHSERIARHVRAMALLGLHPAFCGHNHSPALEVMPNGDLLMAIFTSWEEYEPGMAIIATRLRFGNDEWDMPSLFMDMPDACDNTPLLWKDETTVRFFWANTHAAGAYPFSWIETNDSGANWSDVQFPQFTTLLGPHSRQPINTMLKDKEGRVFLPSDGEGPSSVLWLSRDGLHTWEDPGGRTGGRHTTITLLSDGESILGLGGKSSEIGGYMPQSISRDQAKSWTVSETPFPAYGSNQRPCVIRLKSGRLFFCGDLQRIDGASPVTVSERGAMVALSEDDGETWIRKKLPGAQPHEDSEKVNMEATLGYSVARQAPDGLIHVITTMNKPCLHFAMNESWILATESNSPPNEALMTNSAHVIRDVNLYSESYPDGKPKHTWNAGVGDDGRYLLHGPESWFYSDGTKCYETTYELGQKTGLEISYAPNGQPEWKRDHTDKSNEVMSIYWQNGNLKSRSHWREFHAHGEAVSWNLNGDQTDCAKFDNGQWE
ncbi:MAG: hypothetical protein AMXMBFR84_15230 [Candidatus Hydrogenedentota bacterium]